MRKQTYKYRHNIFQNSKKWYICNIKSIKNDVICFLTNSAKRCYNSNKTVGQGVHDLTEEEIKNSVSNILQETDLGVAPIKIVSIANFYGFKIYEMQMDNSISGLIMADDKNIQGFDSNRIIVVNSNHTAQRKRFTIAHELGHYFNQGRPSQCYAHRDSGNYGPAERDANSFASAILMPEDEIVREVNNFKKSRVGEFPDYQIAHYISDAFDVSQSAAEFRLKKLGII